MEAESNCFSMDFLQSLTDPFKLRRPAKKKKKKKKKIRSNDLATFRLFINIKAFYGRQTQATNFLSFKIAAG